MTLTIEQLDAMTVEAAAARLTACCGSRAWLAAMLSRRPFRTRERLLVASDEAARGLTRADWLEAFSHHPRIGERSAAAAVSATAVGWSSGEQSLASRAGADLRTALIDANAEYEARFGFIFIICASGRHGEDILAVLRERMRNEDDAELLVAAHEQQLITSLRLQKLVPSAQTAATTT